MECRARRTQQRGIVHQRRTRDDLTRGIVDAARESLEEARGLEELSREHGNAVHVGRQPLDVTARRLEHQDGQLVLDLAAQGAELRDERVAAQPAGVPVRECHRRPPPPEIAVGVGAKTRDSLTVIAGKAEQVGRGAVQRRLARAVDHRQEHHPGKTPSDIAQNELVGAGARGDDRIDVLELRQAPQLGVQHAELERLGAAGHELDLPPRDADRSDAFQRLTSAPPRPPFDQRKLRA